MRALRLFIIGALLLGAASGASAEVADKEPSIEDMWVSSVIFLAVILGASAWKRGLGIGLWILGSLLSFGPIMEWHDPYVGPAIERELGVEWSWHAYASTIAIWVIPAIVFLGLFLCDRHAASRGGGYPPNRLPFPTSPANRPASEAQAG